MDSINKQNYPARLAEIQVSPIGALFSLTLKTGKSSFVQFVVLPVFNACNSAINAFSFLISAPYIKLTSIR